MVEKHFKSTTRCYRCFALGLYAAARVSEHVRAGINTVSRGQSLRHQLWDLPPLKVIVM